MPATIALLYAEDNPQDADLTRAHFEQHAPDFTLTIADSGAQCMGLLAREPFDLLLLDNRLPDVDGIDLLAQLRQQGFGLPVVMVTGVGDEDTVARALRAGAVDYVPKAEGYLEHLPALLRQRMAHHRERLALNGGASSRHWDVLYVEPNPMDAELTQQQFAQHAPHLRLRVVPDCHQALALLAQPHAFDLVLTDLRVPGMDALEFLHEAQRRSIDLPFIVITGRGDEDTAVAILRLGAYDYIVKRDNYLTQLPYAIEQAMQRFELDRTTRRLRGELASLNASLEQKVKERTEALQREIDERARTQQALERSWRQFRSLTENMPDVVVRFDHDLRHTYANPAIVVPTGKPPEAFIGRTNAEMDYPPALAERFDAALRRAFEGVAEQRLEFAFPGPDGERFWESRVVPEWGSDGQVESVMVLSRDYTERRQAEQARVALAAQLRESQKMEAIGTLAGGIAHDFNNIIGGILGNAALATQDLALDHPAQGYLGQIQKAATRARALVQQILAFSRRQPQELASVMLQPLVQETLALLRATLPAMTRVHTVLPDAPLHVLADANQLQQVLLNLCTNASHALHGSSGEIEVGLELQPADGSLPPRVHLWVRDTGVGMDEDTRAHLFEPFFTTKPVGQGTGLGLAVVHGIVAAHQGSITVDSAPGHGSTFHVYLPTHRSTDGADTSAPPPAPTLPGNGAHVLYIDDDEVMLLMAERLLVRAGYRATVARDAAEAIALVRADPQSVDLVVTDFSMPGLSGLEVARALRELRPTLPVAISSGYLADDLRDEASALGVRGLIQKQNTFDELLPLVQRVLGSGA